MDHIHARHVILGAGAMGTAAAYHLAKRGEPVLLVERFAIGHDRGSSHGAARVIRHSYSDLRYAQLVPEAFRTWSELEADAGQNFYVRTGVVSVCRPGLNYVQQVAENLQAVGVPSRRMSGADLKRVMPAWSGPDNDDVIFEPDAGMLSAARIVQAQADLARAHGGDQMRLIEHCPIQTIDLDGSNPTLIAGSLQITADRLIVAAGAWVGRLLPTLGVPLRVTRQHVFYFRPDDPAPFAIGRFPIFIDMEATRDEAYYGMPDHLGSGIKVARHGGPDVDPETVDRDVSPQEEQAARTFLRGRVPRLAEAPIARAEVCLYTVTPTDHFLIGPLPDRPDVIVASPCSGHGFKFANLIGRVLADLSQTGDTDLEIDYWTPS